MPREVSSPSSVERWRLLLKSAEEALLHALGFLRLVFGDDAEGYLLILTGDGQSGWFEAADFARAARLAVTVGREQDVYFGAALRRERSAQRDGVYAVPGLWASIRTARLRSNVGAAPASRREALDLLRTLPLPPTVVVQGGQDLQAYWLFRSPWRLLADHDRRQAEALSACFQAALTARGTACGWEWEDKGDLTVALRLPGSLDHSSIEPTPVHILELEPSRRYNLADFEAHCLDVSAAGLKMGQSSECPPPPAQTDVAEAGDVWDQQRFTGGTLDAFHRRLESAGNSRTWRAAPDARESARREAESEAIEALTALGEADATAVARHLGKSRSTMQVTLRRMWLNGKVHRREVKYGRSVRVVYGLPPAQTL